MRHSSLAVVGVLVILVGAAGTAAAQRVYQVNKSFSGASAPIAMDSNHDGIPAVRAIGAGPGFSMPYPYQSTLRTNPNLADGAFSADLVSEGAPVEEPTGRCAENEVEFEMIHYTSVHRYWHGDLLFSGLIEGFTCVDPLTGVAHGVLLLEHLGGTGRFEGAWGETVREFQAWALEPSGLRAALIGRETGELILP